MTIILKILFMAAGIISTGCYFSNSNAKFPVKEKLLKCQYRFSLPQITDDGSISLIEDTVTIYQGNEFTLYKFPEADSLLIIDYVVKRKTRFYSAALQKNGDKTGFFFNSNSTSDTVRVINMDSIFAAKAMFTSDFFSGDGLSYLETRMKDNDLIKVFSVKKMELEGSVDSVFCYFGSKQQGIEYTFSKSQDTFQNLKLYRIQMCVLPFFSKKMNLKINRYEYNYELAMEELTAEDVKYYNSFVEAIVKGNN